MPGFNPRFPWQRPTKLEKVEIRHERSLGMAEHQVQTINVAGGSGKTWLVKSQYGGGAYHVMKWRPNCKCYLWCDECDACVHSFKCSCPDSDNGYMCKHIHLVCRVSRAQANRQPRRPERSVDHQLPWKLMKNLEIKKLNDMVAGIEDRKVFESVKPLLIQVLFMLKAMEKSKCLVGKVLECRSSESEQD